MFSEAVISFSVGGQHFQEDAIRYAPDADHIFESSRNVSIKLHHRIGKWVRIELHFAARWILISEVVFDSGEWRHVLVAHSLCTNRNDKYILR